MFLIRSPAAAGRRVLGLALAVLVTVLGTVHPALAQSQTATLVYPANGAVNADLSQPITWTSVPNVQAYYLYVGTAVGAKDLVDTGELQPTSYLAPGLPSGQTLYARIHTKIGGAWRYTDSTFSAAPSAPVKATLTYPVNGAVNADLTQPVQWTSVANVQAYYLYVGTVVGAKDLVDTGELQQTSYLAFGLPADQTLYARMYTKVGGVWRYSESTFSAAPSTPVTATLSYPGDGAVDIDPLLPATWTNVVDAEAYRLTIGSTAGANDILDSFETLYTFFAIGIVPPGPTLHATLWTKVGGIWRSRQSTFTASSIAPRFNAPTDGAIAVGPAQPFEWTPPANTTTNSLRVGTSPGAADVFDSGHITTTSVVVSGLPSTGLLYAAASSMVNDIWRRTDIRFTLEASIAPSTMLAPSGPGVPFDTVEPFEWTAVPIARGYRLTIGTSPGASDLHDSGEILVTRRFVPDLPLGSLFGRLSTKIAGQWYASDFAFTVAANTVAAAPQIDSALWATDLVRGMASSDNRVFGWTTLAKSMGPQASFASCFDYAEGLLDVLNEMNAQLSARRLAVALNPNTYDTHTLVEMFDPDSGRWMLLDPTFDLTVKRMSDGEWATAEDVSAAARAEQWGDLSFVFLGDVGDQWARNYYLDYPLLFVNVYHPGQPAIPGQGAPVVQYFEEVPLPVSGAPTAYAVGCSGEQTAALRVDGSDVTIDCSGVDGLSYIFTATTISANADTAPSVKVYQPRRYVFTPGPGRRFVLPAPIPVRPALPSAFPRIPR